MNRDSYDHIPAYKYISKIPDLFAFARPVLQAPNFPVLQAFRALCSFSPSVYRASKCEKKKTEIFPPDLYLSYWAYRTQRGLPGISEFWQVFTNCADYHQLHYMPPSGDNKMSASWNVVALLWVRFFFLGVKVGNRSGLGMRAGSA